MRITLLLAALALAGCQSIAANRPIVDMEGVDQVKYNRDLAACEQKAAETLVGVGNITSRCMNERGYKILRWN